jgi:sigma-B regulation protein RsbU (phosphoserine phosphatase)
MEECDTMNTVAFEQIQDSLQEKRAGLTDLLNTAPSPKKQTLLGPMNEKAVHMHLDVLDATLEKAASKTLGVCSVCHGAIEAGLLEMDYTANVCLGDLPAEESRQLELELELAQTVQKSLLPQQVPDTPLLEIAAFSRPAQIVGGDYFDFFRFQDGADGLAIADVAGHGISASLHMAGLQALLRTLIPASDSPAGVVERVQRLLIHNVRFSTFVTLFLSSFDSATHTFTYCNAGHNPPLVFRSGESQGETVRWLWPTGAAIALIEESEFREEKIRLEPGDVLLLYTDGVTEAMNEKGEEFGREKLAEVVRHEASSSAKDLIQRIRQELAEFTGRQSLADDATIVACKIAL